MGQQEDASSSFDRSLHPFQLFLLLCRIKSFARGEGGGGGRKKHGRENWKRNEVSVACTRGKVGEGWFLEAVAYKQVSEIAEGKYRMPPDLPSTFILIPISLSLILSSLCLFLSLSFSSVRFLYAYSLRFNCNYNRS